MNQQEVKDKIKSMLVSRLNLDRSPSEIEDDKPLFRPVDTDSDDGLNLDSIEALEIVVGLEQAFSFKIRNAEYQEEFRSVNSLTDFVLRCLNEASASGT